MKKLLIRSALTILFIFFLIIVGYVSYKFGKGQGSHTRHFANRC